MQRCAVMITMTLIVCLGQGCSKKDGAKETFESSIRNLQDAIESSEYYVSLDELKYDIFKTDSLVTPYTAILEMIYTERVSPEKAKSIADSQMKAYNEWASRMREGGTSMEPLSESELAETQKLLEDSGVIRYKYTVSFSYQNDSWHITGNPKTAHKRWDEERDENKDTYLDSIYQEKANIECSKEEIATLNRWLNIK